MSILDITFDNFDVTVANTARRIDFIGEALDTERSWFDSLIDGRRKKDLARQVYAEIRNDLEKKLGELVGYPPNGRHVGKLVSDFIGKKVNCRKQTYTGKYYQGVVTYHLSKPGCASHERAYGIKFLRKIEDRIIEVRISRIDIVY